MSQADVAKASGTSQSAIARIESGEENITLETLERIVTALDGWFFVLIPPRESAPKHLVPWWETNYSSAHSWKYCGSVSFRNNQTEQMLVGFEREHQQNVSANTLPQGVFLVATASMGA